MRRFSLFLGLVVAVVLASAGCAGPSGPGVTTDVAQEQEQSRHAVQRAMFNEGQGQY